MSFNILWHMESCEVRMVIKHFQTSQIRTMRQTPKKVRTYHRKKIHRNTYIEKKTLDLFCKVDVPAQYMLRNTTDYTTIFLQFNKSCSKNSCIIKSSNTKKCGPSYLMTNHHGQQEDNKRHCVVLHSSLSKSVYSVIRLG